MTKDLQISQKWRWNLETCMLHINNFLRLRRVQDGYFYSRHVFWNWGNQNPIKVEKPCQISVGSGRYLWVRVLWVFEWLKSGADYIEVLGLMIEKWKMWLDRRRGRWLEGVVVGSEERTVVGGVIEKKIMNLEWRGCKRYVREEEE